MQLASIHVPIHQVFFCVCAMPSFTFPSKKHLCPHNSHRDLFHKTSIGPCVAFPNFSRVLENTNIIILPLA